jgi:hypothetical protein
MEFFQKRQGEDVDEGDAEPLQIIAYDIDLPELGANRKKHPEYRIGHEAADFESTAFTVTGKGRTTL